MKKLVFGLGIFMLGAVSLNASNIENSSDIKESLDDTKIVKIERLETNTVLVNVEGVMFKRYRGICLNGITFSFSATNDEQAQGYVNGYCAAISD